MTYAPDHVFLIPGAIMLAVGLGLQAMLVAGPIRLFGLPMGIHFLALGSLLTLAGYNVLNLGVLGKIAVALKHPRLGSRVVSLISRRFSLETGLILGGVLALAGFLTDVVILVYWMRSLGDSLEETVHLAFVASTMIVLGVNIMFTSFLVNLLLSEEKLSTGETQLLQQP